MDSTERKEERRKQRREGGLEEVFHYIRRSLD